MSAAVIASTSGARSATAPPAPADASHDAHAEVVEPGEQSPAFLRDRVPERRRGRGQVHDLGQVDGAEQQHRIEVLVARPEAEVEHLPVVVDARSATRAEHLAGAHDVAPAHRRGAQVRVRGAKAARVRDDDVPRARDRACERDLARAGGPYRGARRRAEVDTEMARAVVRLRRVERADEITVDGLVPHGRGLGRGRGRRRDADERATQTTDTQNPAAGHADSPEARRTRLGEMPGEVASR